MILANKSDNLSNTASNLEPMRGSHVLRELIRCMAEKLEDFLSACSSLRRYRDTAMVANGWLSESLKQANVWPLSMIILVWLVMARCRIFSG